MILVVVLVILVGLAAAFVVAVAKDPGATPADVALGYEHAWDLLDFDVVYRLSGSELHGGLAKADFIAAQRRACADRPAGQVAQVAPESETRTGDEAAVVTRLTRRDGNVVRHEVRLLRRSRAWEVVAYEPHPAPAA